MLLWVINHFNSDFEDSPSMEKHLERFEKGLEKHVSSASSDRFRPSSLTKSILPIIHWFKHQCTIKGTVFKFDNSVVI